MQRIWLSFYVLIRLRIGHLWIFNNIFKGDESPTIRLMWIMPVKGLNCVSITLCRHSAVHNQKIRLASVWMFHFSLACFCAIKSIKLTEVLPNGEHFTLRFTQNSGKSEIHVQFRWCSAEDVSFVPFRERKNKSITEKWIQRRQWFL